MPVKIPHLEVPKGADPLGGLYILSHLSPAKTNNLYKFGKSVNIKQRLTQQYSICPETAMNGIWVYSLVIARGRTKAQRKQRIDVLEKRLFEVAKEHHQKPLTGKREMFKITRSKLTSILEDFYQQNRAFIEVIYFDPVNSIHHIKAKHLKGTTTQDNINSVFGKETTAIDKAVKQREKFEKKKPQRAPKRKQAKRKSKTAGELKKLEQLQRELGIQ